MNWLFVHAQYSDKSAIYHDLLMDEFKMRKIGDNTWVDSIWLPNSIHQILYQRKIIPNPYFGDNEKDLKWIEESDWEIEGPLEYWYDEKIISTELYFHRLEPFVEVYLNDVFLFESKNSFIPYKFEIQQLLKKENNRIKFICKSPVKEAKKLEQQNGILPGDERVYVRKPQFEFGWDWGPRFVTSGITDYITIVSHFEKFADFKDVYSKNISIEKQKAVVQLEIEILSEIDQSKYLSIKCQKEDNDILINKKIQLKKGLNKITSEIEIKNPRLWWPNGMGQQDIYNIKLGLNSKKKRGNIDFESVYFYRHIFCNIELIKEKDSLGESFYFNVNGRPTYLKGFNIIPSFHIEEFSNNGNDKLRNVLCELDDLNCNAIRVWGGGNYLSNDELNTLMDLGIIVWQDFMFAGGMYPGDSSFLNNVEEEITYQVKRLRNYNNVALYCGNNEIDEAWHNWGWQKQYNYSKEDSTKIWQDYLKLYHELIPSIVKKYDPDTDYIPSSPEIGWGRKESMSQGDSHYWGVWWGKEPIETFEEKIPRFMSEFGMQAMPDLSTLRKVIPDSLMNFDSPEFKNHQKHPTGFETLNYYLEKYLTVPDNMEDYAYATQLLQTITLQKAIEAQRVSQKCMGTLIWQLNDTWPVTSWSVIDSEEKRKLAFEYVKKGFENEYIGMKKNKSEYLFSAICNPKFYLQCFPKKDSCWYEMNSNVSLKLEIRNFSGENYLDTIMLVNLEPNQSKLFLTVKKESLKNFTENNSYCKYTLNPASEPEYSTSKIDYFVPLRELEIEKPKLAFSSKIVEKKVWKSHHTSETENLPFYEITCKAMNDIHFLQLNDTIPSENFYRFIEGPLRGYPNKIPGELITSDEFKLLYKKSDFITEQEAINYVKNNLKSLNHLMGK